MIPRVLDGGFAQSTAENKAKGRGQGLAKRQKKYIVHKRQS